MALAPVALDIVAGSSKPFILKLIKDDGAAPANPLDVTGATSIRWIAKPNTGLPDTLAPLHKDLSSGITVLDAADGIVQLQLLPADTAKITLSAVTYGWSCKVFFSSLEQETGASGSLLITPSDVLSTTP